ncbi:MAG: hypothetical protein U5K31_07750 [Balneolaceae bacterium]|nr:hypothetical protein [Balneolaceae bacterium]
MDVEAIIIVAIVFGTPLVGFTLYGIYRLLKLWIGGPSGEVVPRQDFNRLGKAFVEFKKDAERRIRNLEAIATEEEDDKSASQSSGSGTRQLGGPTDTIEVEGGREGNPKEAREQKNSGESSDGSNLRNMLRE